jgi:multisubunit Na+/H+ antiporter MnhC subunit
MKRSLANQAPVAFAHPVHDAAVAAVVVTAAVGAVALTAVVAVAAAVADDLTNTIRSQKIA